MCVTYPGQVLESAGGFALVVTQGRTQRASTLLVPETSAGDWVVVAAGAVLQIIDADEARAIRELLDKALQEEGATVEPVTARSVAGRLER